MTPKRRVTPIEEHTPSIVDARIAAIVAAAPPLTAEQRSTIAALGKLFAAARVESTAASTQIPRSTSSRRPGRS